MSTFRGSDAVEKFFSARLNKPKDHNNGQSTIDNLVNALEVVNNQAKKDGIATGESRAGNMLNQIKTLTQEVQLLERRKVL